MIPLGLFVALCIAFFAGVWSCHAYRDRVEADRQAWRDWMAER